MGGGQEAGEQASIWEDGIGRKDIDARVLSHERTTHTPDPQSTRYGQGTPEVIVQAVVGGPVFRNRPSVDVYWHEGLRPSWARLTPAEARRIGEMILRAAERAEQEPGPG